MSDRSELEADLKRQVEQQPKLEANVSQLTSKLQEAQIALDTCKARIVMLKEQLG